MDNRVFSQIKRAFRIDIDYFICLILFFILIVPVVSLAKDNSAAFMPYLSVLLFLLLVSTVYGDMRTIAFQEKRPQYNINPSPLKGFFYGVLSIIPLVLIQVALILIQVPADYAVLKTRLLQGFTGPIYWFARLLGNEPVHYIASMVLVVIMAGLGYYAGHKDFMLVSYVKKKLGIKDKVKKPVRKPANRPMNGPFNRQ